MVKFVMPEKVADPDTRKRFLREPRLASRLLRPSTAVIYEVGEWQDQVFLAVVYMPGETLSKRLKSGPFPVAVVLPIGRQLAAVLAAGHRQGIVDRDVKPGAGAGTPAYLSAERINGQPGDARHDLGARRQLRNRLRTRASEDRRSCAEDGRNGGHRAIGY